MPPEEGLRMLVVDDDEAYRVRLCRAFRDRGLVVEEAASIAEAVDMIGSFRPQRAVLDLRLSDGSGIDLLENLLAQDPELQCVLLTGYGSISTAVEAVRRGAVHYLTKPADADEILMAFEQSPEASNAQTRATSVPSLHRVEWEHIHRVLHDCGGNVSEAARRLGMHRRTLQRKLATLPPEK